MACGVAFGIDMRRSTYTGGEHERERVVVSRGETERAGDVCEAPRPTLILTIDDGPVPHPHVGHLLAAGEDGARAVARACARASVGACMCASQRAFGLRHAHHM